MPASVLTLFVAVPLVVSAVLVLVPFGRLWSVVTLGLTLLASIGGGIWMVASTYDGSSLGHAVGLWPAGISIPFVGDQFSALMITLTGILTITCVAFAVASSHAHLRFFAPLVLVLTAGVNGALLTADLFNLFVFIEVMLLPSYGLLVLSSPGRAPLKRVSGSRLYVTANLLISTIFLAGVGVTYGVAGTVNLGELAGAARESTAVAIAVAVCLFALSMKAAVVPVHGWLARTYPSASPAVTALFSGLHTKVAIYAIYRIYAVVFEGMSEYLWIGVVMFSLTMAVGVLGAVGEGSTRSILAFHMVSQIGYILLGVALFGPLGLAAGIFYLLHHMIVKASLFLSTGAIEVRYGTGPLGTVHGIARAEPLVAVAFFVAAMSLAGIPPFSGFVAKLSLLQAAFDGGQVAAAVVALVVSIVTLMSMLKIWSGTFWGRAGRTPEQPGEVTGEFDEVALRDAATILAVQPRRKISFALAAPAVFLAALTVGLGIGAQGLMALSEVAAGNLVDTSSYVQAVMGG
ncbi:monovalent cation/H+ antiporter subunit D family protein [Isoptericola halotolerans]|uniref:Multicomponent Na+:H+ antiporter subunit D n=1 Tax=Isoptericola halotolerans TaxID=300560 RepID=A0ABX2A3J5_9MICO|nr:monovalent cation/H+ antiporter subunit D family protein [Isoptericola halotolerans]NOV96470.1 multicomponent Na+:H+ antiporter subunit D [Isoptericola halotolerans]